MSSKYILCIDASVQTASVALANKNELIALKTCVQQSEHASFIQPAIQEMLNELQLDVTNITAIAVTAGPGSYTGLRVAMASSKGLCYALNIPLITLNTLEVMAYAAVLQIQKAVFYCPLIDARRMEVFTAVYNKQLETILNPQALLLNETSFSELLNKETVCFFGNGAAKWKQVCKHPNAIFETTEWNASTMIEAAWQHFNQTNFASVAYAAPLYLKEFYSTLKTANL